MSEPAPVVVAIEDDPQIRRFLRTSLESHGFQVREAETGVAGIAETAHGRADLVILDLGLPDMDGVEVVKKIRSWSTLPVVVLSARASETDKVAALDAGADDYLTKPFGLGELLARVRVALRHAQGSAQEKGGVFSVASLKVDLAQRRVQVEGKEVHLTPIEYRLLAALVKQAGKVLTHRHLLGEVWGPGYVDRSHYLRVHMASLRHKLEADPAQPRFLLTEAGVGYRLAAE
jgi:two-component system KDP operon response regulator KdpE